MYNWLDVLFVAILFITVLLGAFKGFVKQIIGIFSVIAGLALAVIFYSYVSRIFYDLVSNWVVSNLLGFLFIFLVILFLGSLLSVVFSKMIKGPFKFIDRLLGGIFGAIKGVLICSIIAFALLVFPVNKRWLSESYFAPYGLGISETIIYMIPKELKKKFRRKYQEITGKVKKNAKKI